jgi:hypothetical protein
VVYKQQTTAVWMLRADYRPWPAANLFTNFTKPHTLCEINQAKMNYRLRREYKEEQNNKDSPCSKPRGGGERKLKTELKYSKTIMKEIFNGQHSS